MEGAGKTHLLYRRLAGSAFDTTLGGKLEPTNGFNSEVVFQDSCTFQAWDFGGSSQMREFWPFYTSQVYVSVIVFVLQANECVMRHREAQRVLHWLLSDPYV